MTQLVPTSRSWEFQRDEDHHAGFLVSVMPQEVTRFDSLWFSEPALIEKLSVGTVVHYHRVLFRAGIPMRLGLPTVEPGAVVEISFRPLTVWEQSVIRVELAGACLEDDQSLIEARSPEPPCFITVGGLEWRHARNGMWLLIDVEYDGDWDDQVGHLTPNLPPDASALPGSWEARTSLMHGSEHLAFGSLEECGVRLVRHCVAEKQERRSRR